MLNKVLKADADPRRVQFIERTSAELGTNLELFVSLHAADLDGEAMTMTDVLAMTRLQLLASAYAVRRVKRLITTLRQQLVDASAAARANTAARVKLSIPFMEAFLKFAHPAVKDPLSKRRWE